MSFIAIFPPISYEENKSLKLEQFRNISVPHAFLALFPRNPWETLIQFLNAVFESKGLIPRALFLGEMQNISHEMKSCVRSKDKLGFMRNKPVSRTSLKISGRSRTLSGAKR